MKAADLSIGMEVEFLNDDLDTEPVVVLEVKGRTAYVQFEYGFCDWVSCRLLSRDWARARFNQSF